MTDLATVQKESTPAQALRLQLGNMEGQFRAALPAHIPVERFCRVVMTAVQNNPALLEADRRSLFNSAMRAAQDGLLPDGREGAMVVYNDKSKGKIAQWMPMIAGLRKKVRNSGDIATWDAQVVHKNDEFEFELGDAPFIRHKPNLSEPGDVIAAYSVAVLKSGEKSREVMSIAAINKIRARSRAKDSGPWVTDFEEMCRKTVARRHSKVLPMSTDLDDLIRRDDALYDMEGAREEAKQLTGGRPQNLAGKLSLLVNDPVDPPPTEPQSTASEENGTAAADEQNDASDKSEPSDAAPPAEDHSDKPPLAQEGARAAEMGTATLDAFWNRLNKGERKSVGGESQLNRWKDIAQNADRLAGVDNSDLLAGADA